MSALVKQATKHLLIDPRHVAIRQDRGITWVTDRYTVCRADLFRQLPKPKGDDIGRSFRAKTLREVLGWREITRPRRLTDTNCRGDNRGTEFAVVTDGRVFLAVSATVWRGYHVAGLAPYRTDDGRSVCWFANVRGKPALFAVTMTLLPFSLVGLREVA